VIPLTWQDLADRLAQARNYWLHTTSPAGGPQVTPVWGAVVGGDLYHYSLRRTVKARNLRQNPGVAVHLESGADVVIVYGTLADVGRPQEATAVVQAFAAKYDQPQEQPFLPGADPAFDVLYRLRPERALVWSLPDSEASMRRWVAEQ
jgi:nitroimidazol reductase NimA-like FMN-containing flavoprotein (pyridoxamine 5'-phosphate oxidase superfamily)